MSMSLSPYFPIPRHGAECSLGASAEIERILNPNGKVASKLRFIAVVLYKADKAKAAEIKHLVSTLEDTPGNNRYKAAKANAVEVSHAASTLESRN